MNGQMKKSDVIDFEKDQKKVRKIIQKSDKEREEWGKILKNLIDDSGSVSNLPDVENRNLSYRHQIVDKIAVYKKMINNIKSDIKEKKKSLKHFYRTSYNVKLSPKESQDYIDSDLRFKYKILGVLEYQIDYFNKVIETFDKLGFVIKNKYDFQKHY